MDITKIPIGDNPPESLNVIIEVPVNGEPVKYEFDKASGALFVDRILHTPMRYPANYGFVPHTLSPDGDPLDALVIARSPFIPGCVVRARPIGVLNLEDEAGGDEKLICVPVDTTFPYYSDIGERQDLPSIVLQQIEHFFTHYKDFAYFAFTLGMTFQTSDVSIRAAKLRHVVLLHSFGAFTFNIGVIAFTINALGGGK